MSIFYSHRCHINKTGMFYNGEPIHRPESDNIKDIFKEYYKQLDLQYPKFFKMDNLCKAGILGVEVLVEKAGLKGKYADNEVALLFANRSSCFDADTEHSRQYREALASPATFVYTLPNIVIGEVCIRHQFYGESNFYIFDRFNPTELLENVEVIFEETPAKACILGWVECREEEADVFFILLEKEQGSATDAEILYKLKTETDGKS